MSTPVKVAIVTNKNVEARRIVTGNLEAFQTSIVASQESGLIILAKIQEGQKVIKGSTLIELDNTKLKIELEQAKLQSQKANNYFVQREIELKNANKELDRLVTAENQIKGSTSQLEIQKKQKEIDLLKSALFNAEHDKNLALLNVQMFETRLKNMTIVAPFDGVIIKKSIEIGQWINPGNPIVSLNSIDVYKAKLEIPETISFNEFKPESKLEILVVGNSKPFESDQIQVIPEINSRSRTYFLTALIKDNQSKLISGQSVQAYIPIGPKKDYLIVPTDAVTKDIGGNFVYKVIPGENGASMVLAVNVNILFLEGTSYFIESPSLKADDQVVIEGNERLRPMAPVNIIPESKK